MNFFYHIIFRILWIPAILIYVSTFVCTLGYEPAVESVDIFLGKCCNFLDYICKKEPYYYINYNNKPSFIERLL